MAIVIETVKEHDDWCEYYECDGQGLEARGFVLDYDAMCKDWEDNYLEPDWYVGD